MQFKVFCSVAGMLLLVTGCGFNTSEQEYLEQAQSAMQAGRDSEAMIALKNALEANPSNARARLMLGDIYLQKGGYLEAEKELLKAKELNIGSDQWIEPLALSYIRMRNGKRLLEEISAPGLEDDSAVIKNVMRGFGHLIEGQNDEAQAGFDAALAERPDNQRAQFGLASLALAEKEIERAQALVSKLLEANSSLAEVWVLAGDIESYLSDYDLAIQYYQKAVDIADYPPVEAQVKLALLAVQTQQLEKAKTSTDWLKANAAKSIGTRYVEGLIAFNAKDFQQAATLLEGVRNTRMVPHVKLYLGTAHYALGNFEQAGLLLTQYLEESPNASQAKRMLSATLLNNRDFVGAEKVLSSFIDKDDDDLINLSMLANTKLALRKQQEGIGALRRLRELAPDSLPARSKLAMALAMDPETQQEGILMLENIAAELEGSAEANLILALMYVKAKRYDDLQRMAQGMMENKPNDPFAYNLQAVVSMSKNDYVGAQKYLNKALELSPGDSFAGAGLGRLALLTGRIDEAEDYYQQVLEKNPADDRALVGVAKIMAGRGELVAAKLQLQEWLANYQSLPVHLLLASFRLADGEHAQVERSFEALEQTYQDQPAFWGLLGDARMIADAPSKALDAYLEMAKLRPDSAHANYMVALSYSEMGQGNKSIATLERSIQLAPTYEPALLLRAQIAVGSGDKNAPRYLNELIELVGNHPESMLLSAEMTVKAGGVLNLKKYQDFFISKSSRGDYIQRFVSLLGRNDLDVEAIATLRRWLKINPDDQARQMMLVAMLMKANQMSAAEDQLVSILKASPDNWMAKNNLAWLLREREPKRALSLIQEAAIMAPKSPDVFDTYGQILMVQGESVVAVERFQNAIDLAPGNMFYEVQKARAILQSGDKQGARKVLERVVKAADGVLLHSAQQLLDSMER